jgi:hypothetical protein
MCVKFGVNVRLAAGQYYDVGPRATGSRTAMIKHADSSPRCLLTHVLEKVPSQVYGQTGVFEFSSLKCSRETEWDKKAGNHGISRITIFIIHLILWGTDIHHIGTSREAVTRCIDSSE